MSGSKSFIEANPVLGVIALAACLCFIGLCGSAFVRMAWKLERDHQAWEARKAKP
jgi:predicted small integral membrane protein